MLFFFAMGQDGLYYRSVDGLSKVESISVTTKDGEVHDIIMDDYNFLVDGFSKPSYVRSVVFMNDVEVWLNPFDTSYLHMTYDPTDDNEGVDNA